jgi:hypothetical protein
MWAWHPLPSLAQESDPDIHIHEHIQIFNVLNLLHATTLQAGFYYDARQELIHVQQQRPTAPISWP